MGSGSLGMSIVGHTLLELWLISRQEPARAWCMALIFRRALIFLLSARGMP